MTGDPSKRSRTVAGRITNRGEHEGLVMKLGLKRGHDMLYLEVTLGESSGTHFEGMDLSMLCLRSGTSRARRRGSHACSRSLGACV